MWSPALSPSFCIALILLLLSFAGSSPSVPSAGVRKFNAVYSLESVRGCIEDRSAEMATFFGRYTCDMIRGASDSVSSLDCSEAKVSWTPSESRRRLRSEAADCDPSSLSRLVVHVTVLVDEDTATNYAKSIASEDRLVQRTAAPQDLQASFETAQERQSLLESLRQVDSEVFQETSVAALSIFIADDDEPTSSPTPHPSLTSIANESSDTDKAMQRKALILGASVVGCSFVFFLSVLMSSYYRHRVLRVTSTVDIVPKS